jgi:sugar fermentation stimulation protein A
MRGIYVLVLRLPFSLPIPIGALGKIDFKEGYYAYVGSAMSGVEQRVNRHLRQEKNLHWHIDYLLLRALPCDVIVAETEERKECELATKLAKRFPYVEGFGSSDCGCKSHLFYCPSSPVLLKAVLETMNELGLKPRRWKVG